MDWGKVLGGILTGVGGALGTETAEEKAKREEEEKTRNNIMLGVAIFAGLVFLFFIGLAVTKK